MAQNKAELQASYDALSIAHKALISKYNSLRSKSEELRASLDAAKAGHVGRNQVAPYFEQMELLKRAPAGSTLRGGQIFTKGGDLYVP